MSEINTAEIRKKSNEDGWTVWPHVWSLCDEIDRLRAGISDLNVLVKEGEFDLRTQLATARTEALEEAIAAIRALKDKPK